jgi:molecular chaperone DnaK
MKLKKAAEDYLGEKVTEAVITVPAYFNDAQRQATKDAGRIAGLDVKRIVNEPTAAALAYGLDKKKDEVIAVYDFGGGTFDISILEVGDNVVQVISTNGDTHLGGDDIDNLIIDWMIAEFKKSERGRSRARTRWLSSASRRRPEKAKIELSSVQETSINLPFVTVGPGGPMHLDMRLSRAKLEQMIGPLVERSMEPVRKALADAKKQPKDIDEVVLVGGSTRIPLVKETVKKFFGKDPHQGVNPDEVVAIGAAVQAGVLSGDVKDLVLLDVTPLSARRRDARRRDDGDDPAQHDHPDAEEGGLLDGDRQPAERRDPRPAGRANRGAYNRTLGKFHLEGIMPAPRGVPQGRGHVRHRRERHPLGPRQGHGDGQGPEDHHHGELGAQRGEIQKMVKEAAGARGEDKERREQIERRNKLDNLCYTLEKTLSENKDKLPAPT